MHPFLVIGSCSSEGPSMLLLVIGITYAILVIEMLLAELAKLIVGGRRRLYVA